MRRIASLDPSGHLDQRDRVEGLGGEFASRVRPAADWRGAN
jgi:hypothetical protein